MRVKRFEPYQKQCEYCGRIFWINSPREKKRRFCPERSCDVMYRQRGQRLRQAEIHNQQLSEKDKRIDSMDAKLASQADAIHTQSLHMDKKEFEVRQERERREQLEKEIRMAADQIDRLFASGTLKADHDSPTWQQDRHLTQWQEVISHYAKPAEPDPYDELMELDRQFREGKNRWKALEERAKRELPPNPTDEERRYAIERVDEIFQREELWTAQFFQAHPRLRAWHDLLDYADNFRIEHGYLPDERIAEYARLKALVDGKTPKQG